MNAAKDLCALEASEFNRQLTVASDNRLGLLECISERVSFPLTMRYAQEWIYQRQVLVGDAAHTIHPLAGQGVNLGFADAHLLAEVLNGLGTLNGQWDQQQLQRQLRHYQRARKNRSTASHRDHGKFPSALPPDQSAIETRARSWLKSGRPNLIRFERLFPATGQ